MWQKSCVFDSRAVFGRGPLTAVRSRQHTHSKAGRLWFGKPVLSLAVLWAFHLSFLLFLALSFFLVCFIIVFSLCFTTITAPLTLSCFYLAKFIDPSIYPFIHSACGKAGGLTQTCPTVSEQTVVRTDTVCWTNIDNEGFPHTRMWHYRCGSLKKVPSVACPSIQQVWIYWYKQCRKLYRSICRLKI